MSGRTPGTLRQWLAIWIVGAASLVAPMLLALATAPLQASPISPDEAKDFFEIRVYNITPGSMDAFVKWMETVTRWQETTGMQIVGQFAAPQQNKYVWIRQYPDEATRKKRFEAVYGSGGMKQFGTPPGYEGGDVYLAAATKSSRLQFAKAGLKAMPARSGPGGPAIYEFRIYDIKPGTSDSFSTFMSDRMIPWQERDWKVNAFAQLVPYSKVTGSAGGGKVAPEERTYIWGRTFASETERLEKYKMYQDPAFKSVGSPSEAGLDKVRIVILTNPTSFSKLQ